MTHCKWMEPYTQNAQPCGRVARFEVETTAGWKPVCRRHAMRYGHWTPIRRVVVPA